MYWLLLEGNKEEDDFTFFGYCKILEAEFGYVSFNELHSLKYDIQYIHHSIPISLEELQAKYIHILIRDKNFEYYFFILFIVL